jgi:multicomponent Na+:H+ antiporter subunit A
VPAALSEAPPAFHAPWVAYAGEYLEGHPRLGRFYGWLLLFMASMLGLVLADNGLLLFVAWELTTLSSFILIGSRPRRRRRARRPCRPCW